MKRCKRILIALRLGYSSNRNYLAGIARFLRYTPNWKTTVLENFVEFTPRFLAGLNPSSYDGIITTPPHDARITVILNRQTIPLVLFESDDIQFERKVNIIYVKGDNHRIGILAARHFDSLGTFRSAAFVSTKLDMSWMQERFQGFCRGFRPESPAPILISSPKTPGSPSDIRFLSKRLAALPQPIAVMADYDQRAVHVLQACEEAGLSVPEQVQIIGVDNDSIFCDFSKPTLTSVATNQIRKGEVAAMELNRLIEHSPSSASTVVLKDAEIVVRESTAPTSPSAHLVERAIRYIEANAQKGILPRDVIAHVGVSRALITQRFKEVERKTIGEVILQTRLKLVRSKLRTTKMKIADITRTSGFNDPDYAKRAFKKAFGTTMRDYRTKL